jgi:hypothetical protein
LLFFVFLILHPNDSPYGVRRLAAAFVGPVPLCGIGLKGRGKPRLYTEPSRNKAGAIRQLADRTPKIAPRRGR